MLQTTHRAFAEEKSLVGGGREGRVLYVPREGLGPVSRIRSEPAPPE